MLAQAVIANVGAVDESALETGSTQTTLPPAMASMPAFDRPLAILVDGVCPDTSSVIAWMRPLRARSDNAPRSAAAIIFFGVRWL